MDDRRIISFRKWAFGAGMFNVIVAFPLSMPFLCEKYLAVFNSLNQALGLSGRELRPPAEGANLLLINTAGLALCLAGMTLIYASFDIKNRMILPFLNALVRTIFPILASRSIMSSLRTSRA